MSRDPATYRRPHAERPGSHGETIASLDYICCGQRLKRIDIHSGESTLSCTFCSRCEAMRWFKDGWPTDDISLGADLREVTNGFRRRPTPRAERIQASSARGR